MPLFVTGGIGGNAVPAGSVFGKPVRNSLKLQEQSALMADGRSARRSNYCLAHRLHEARRGFLY